MPKRTHLLVAMALLAGFLAFLWYWQGNPPPEIPEPDEVEAMQAYIDNSPRQLPDVPLFEVRREHFAPILAALRPCKVDSRPMKWQVLGGLHLKCRGER